MCVCVKRIIMCECVCARERGKWVVSDSLGEAQLPGGF